jgi:hypothetical protein
VLLRNRRKAILTGKQHAKKPARGGLSCHSAPRAGEPLDQRFEMYIVISKP